MARLRVQLCVLPKKQVYGNSHVFLKKNEHSGNFNFNAQICILLSKKFQVAKRAPMYTIQCEPSPRRPTFLLHCTSFFLFNSQHYYRAIFQKSVGKKIGYEVMSRHVQGSVQPRFLMARARSVPQPSRSSDTPRVFVRKMLFWRYSRGFLSLRGIKQRCPPLPLPGCQGGWMD